MAQNRQRVLQPGTAIASQQKEIQTMTATLKSKRRKFRK
jgi:hypothetical protein